MCPGFGGCVELCRTWQGYLGGSGEHRPSCKGCTCIVKGRVASLCNIWLSVRLGLAIHTCMLYTDILNILIRADSHYGELPLPFILIAIVDFLVIIA